MGGGRGGWKRERSVPRATGAPRGGEGRRDRRGQDRTGRGTVQLFGWQPAGPAGERRRAAGDVFIPTHSLKFKWIKVSSDMK